MEENIESKLEIGKMYRVENSNNEMMYVCSDKEKLFFIRDVSKESGLLILEYETYKNSLIQNGKLIIKNSFNGELRGYGPNYQNQEKFIKYIAMIEQFKQKNFGGNQ